LWLPPSGGRMRAVCAASNDDKFFKPFKGQASAVYLLGLETIEAERSEMVRVSVRHKGVTARRWAWCGIPAKCRPATPPAQQPIALPGKLGPEEIGHADAAVGARLISSTGSVGSAGMPARRLPPPQRGKSGPRRLPYGAPSPGVTRETANNRFRKRVIRTSAAKRRPRRSGRLRPDLLATTRRWERG
jgi:hypothetical protein